MLLQNTVLYSWFAPPSKGLWESRRSTSRQTKLSESLKETQRTDPARSERESFLHCCLNRSFLCLSNLQVAWQYLQLGIVKIGWLWRWNVLVYHTGNKMWFTFVRYYLPDHMDQNLFILICKSTNTPSSRSSRLNPVHKGAVTFRPTRMDAKRNVQDGA